MTYPSRPKSAEASVCSKDHVRIFIEASPPHFIHLKTSVL